MTNRSVRQLFLLLVVVICLSGCYETNNTSEIKDDQEDVVRQSQALSLIPSQGDVDWNGRVDIVDAIMVAEYSSGLAPSPFYEEAADVDCDGYITFTDAHLIAKQFVHLTAPFICRTTGFEHLGDWSVTNATAVLSENAAEGQHALSLGDIDSAVLVSAEMSVPYRFDSLELSVWISDALLLHPDWRADISMSLTCDSPTLHNTVVGQYDLTDLSRNTYHTLLFTLDPTTADVLQNGCDNMKVDIALNVPQGSGKTYILDDLQILGCVPQTCKTLGDACRSDTIVPDGCGSAIDCDLCGVRKMSAYGDRDTFIVGDKNWRDVLTMVPVTTWHARSDDEYEACIHPYGGADKVCAYPTLVAYEENEGADLDPIANFMDRYSSDRALYRSLPESAVFWMKSDYPLEEIASDELFSYWHHVEDIVLVEDDYAKALVAAPFAALLGVPLIIEGHNDDIHLDRYNTICIGNVNAACETRYTVSEALNLYVNKSGTNRVVLANASDLTDSVVLDDALDLEYLNHTISHISYRMSLAAPFLSAAKEQVPFVLNQTETTYEAADEFIDTQLRQVGLTRPEYLTIVASPRAIPQSRFFEPVENNVWSQIDGAIYGDLDGDFFQDVKVGRIFSQTISGTSAYTARVLFHDRLPQPDEGLTLKSFKDHSIVNTAAYIDKVAASIGLNAVSSFFEPHDLSNPDYNFDPTTFSDKAYLFYSGHGNPYGVSGGFSTNVFNRESIWLSSSLVVTEACSACSYEVTYNIDKNAISDLFCSNMIRRGAIGFVGAVDQATENPPTNFMQQIFKGADFGHAMRHVNNVSHRKMYQPYFTLIGDPSFNFGYSGDHNEDRLHITTTEPVVQNDDWIMSAEIRLDSQSTVSFNNIRVNDNTWLDMVSTIYYGGDYEISDTFRYSHFYEKPFNPEYDNQYYSRFFRVAIPFDNSQHLNVVGIRRAKIKIGDNPFEDAPWIVNQRLERQRDNTQGQSFLPLQLSTSPNCDTADLQCKIDNAIVSPDTTEVPEITFYLDFVLR